MIVASCLYLTIVMNVIILSLLLTTTAAIFSQAPKFFGKRFITEQTYNAAEDIKTLVTNNNGNPVPPGYHAHSVVFMKKPTFNKNDDKILTNTSSTDFSLTGPFFASGTILNRRWILTRATRIAYYPIGSYWMVSQHSILSPVDEDFLNKYEIDFILIHPGDSETDAALVRTSEPIKFDLETRSVNLGFDEPVPLENCKIVLWSWFFEKENKKVSSMDRGEKDFPMKAEDCPDLSDNFICLSNSESNNLQPCGINSGAPVVCGGILVGIFAGKGAGAVCETPPLTGLAALRTDQGKTQDWLNDVLASPDTFKDDEDKVVLKTCSAGYTAGHYLILLTILLKYMI